MAVYNAHHEPFITVAIVCLVITSTAVLLRFIARGAIQKKYEAEDWFALASLVFFAVWCGLQLWGKFAFL